jgi:hypothetical protein
MVVVCVVGSVMGGVGVGSTSRRCFGREGMRASTIIALCTSNQSKAMRPIPAT